MEREKKKTKDTDKQKVDRHKVKGRLKNAKAHKPKAKGRLKNPTWDGRRKKPRILTKHGKKHNSNHKKSTNMLVYN